ncbi:G-type lectin S-receptor-like serine/threonine-protein kinase At4g27290 [Rhodamnia argentea]|uniref:Receptor-like serine/threonine-protein kinase n=1 Tax=Rhodamnia argentea TaxID=178133 RepID=A0A8B8N682_9MYRT|nr:G-type lectin S-receptor-like serine/threonine-protein kinase At4g27290 [Rhodamnia argentea]XP_048130245.1 G-type lectin S-receptor-like serine/threonine-protein kinase At4g27290 [Rhodamnia argentea]
MGILCLLLFTESLIWFSGFSVAVDTVNASQSISDGKTLVSSGGTFELGFFSPGNLPDRYLGIWYKNVPVRTVVWVANRNQPIHDSSGTLMVVSTGNLVLLNQNRSVVWSTNSTEQAQTPVLQLLDSGNLVLRDDGNDSPDTYLWQSFDYPSDTFLPGLKIGWDANSSLERHLTSWKSPDDPSPGDFTWGMERSNYPELVAWKGSSKYFRSGPWNGLRFSGAPQSGSNPVFSYEFINNGTEAYHTFAVENKSELVRIVVNQTSYLWELSTWNEDSQSWMLFLSVPKDYCDNYGLCGAYSKCLTDKLPYCQCLKGFSPRYPDKWNSNDWSQGCARDKLLGCNDGDGFIKHTQMKLPATTNTWLDGSLSLKDCRTRCLKNCSCTAYSNSDIRGKGSGCVLWFGDLIDMRQYPSGGQDIYIRMSASEIGKSMQKLLITVIVVPAIGLLAAMLTALYCVFRSRMNYGERTENVTEVIEKEGPEDDLELPLFDLITLAKSTNNFSTENKLGEGGFGPVYKGTLVDGQEIAVKRLSTLSRQGLKEFKNEVTLIAKLQHRNLVKLLGCCIQGEEKMLIYEYMANKSLDAFIFDPTRGRLLNWSKRFHIICGVARGLLYLHQDSRLRIIHRDLKASNVLLDAEMNPKISDFGLARIFGGDQTEGNTSRVAGTYGYMAPEYAIDGLFSVKSDVFSYGILVLEIISGKRNRGLYHLESNLIGHAWEMYKSGRSIELIDVDSVDTCTLSEVLRCIHIALLCLQEHPEDRPTMSYVLTMFSSENALPVPKQPGFLVDRYPRKESSSSSKVESLSANEVSFTLLEGR